MNRIKELREKRGLPQKALAADLGVSQPTICDWESGRKIPSAKSTAKLADYFRVSTDYILGREDTNIIPIRDIAKEYVPIPVYPRIPAGGATEANTEVVDYADIPAEWCKGGQVYYGLTVKGDSMYPKYQEGDTIIIRKQPICESGQDCVVYVNGYDATLKTVYFTEDGGIRLKPYNTEYSPKTYYPGKDEPISIDGVVVEIRRKP